MNVSSLKALTTTQMLEISKRCLIEQRAELQKVSETHGALALLERAHRRLEAANLQSPEQAEAMRALTIELGKLDLVHDRRVRGIYYMLTALGEAIDDELLARKYTLLRDVLLPAGLNTTLLRYEEQIRAALDVRKNLTSEHREMLSWVKIPSSRGTLLDQVESWWMSAEALDEVWQKRQALREESGEDYGSAGDLLRARHQWIGALRVLAAALEASTLSQDEIIALLPEIQAIP